MSPGVPGWSKTENGTRPRDRLLCSIYWGVWRVLGSDAKSFFRLCTKDDGMGWWTSSCYLKEQPQKQGMTSLNSMGWCGHINYKPLVTRSWEQGFPLKTVVFRKSYVRPILSGQLWIEWKHQVPGVGVTSNSRRAGWSDAFRRSNGERWGRNPRDTAPGTERLCIEALSLKLDILGYSIGHV